MSANVDRLRQESLPSDVPFISKPFSNEELLAAVRDALRAKAKVRIE